MTPDDDRVDTNRSWSAMIDRNRAPIDAQFPVLCGGGRSRRTWPGGEMAM